MLAVILLLVGFFVVGILTQNEELDSLELFNIKGRRGDKFGSSIAIEGNTIIVGSYLDDFSKRKRDSGSICFFKYNQTTRDWGNGIKIHPDDTFRSDWFGKSVSLSSDYAAIGAPRDDTKTMDTGTVYIYQRNKGGWEKSANIEPEDGTSWNWFGKSVSLKGNVLAVGSSNSNDGKQSGSVYIYERLGNYWQPISKLQPQEQIDFDMFGESVKTNGEYILANAANSHSHSNVIDKGALYVFHRQDGAWIQLEKIESPNPAPYGYFGHSSDVENDWLIVGAHGEYDSKGVVYIFRREQGMWGLDETLFPSNGNAMIIEQSFHVQDGSRSKALSGEMFGFAVAISGDLLAVSAPHNDEYSSHAGCVYVFRHVHNRWDQIKKLLAHDAKENDRFGHTLDIDNSRVIVGAANKNRRRGKVYVFDIES